MAAVGAWPAPRRQVFPGDGISPCTTGRALVAGSVGARGRVGRAHSPSAPVPPWKRSGSAAERHTGAGAAGGAPVVVPVGEPMAPLPLMALPPPLAAAAAAVVLTTAAAAAAAGARRRRPIQPSPWFTGGRTARIPRGGPAPEAGRPTGYGARWPRRTGEAAARERPAVGGPFVDLVASVRPVQPGRSWPRTTFCGLCTPFWQTALARRAPVVPGRGTLACGSAGSPQPGWDWERGTEREDNGVVSGSPQWRHRSSVFRRPRVTPRTGLFRIARQARDCNPARRMAIPTLGTLERRSQIRTIIVNQQTHCAGSGPPKAANPRMAAAR